MLSKYNRDGSKKNRMIVLAVVALILGRYIPLGWLVAASAHIPILSELPILPQRQPRLSCGLPSTSCPRTCCLSLHPSGQYTAWNKLRLRALLVSNARIPILSEFLICKDLQIVLERQVHFSRGLPSVSSLRTCCLSSQPSGQYTAWNNL